MSEARLAFLMCRRKGVGGVIADDIDLAPFESEARTTLARYAAPTRPGRVFPGPVASAIGAQLSTVEADADHIAGDALG